MTGRACGRRPASVVARSGILLGCRRRPFRPESRRPDRPSRGVRAAAHHRLAPAPPRGAQDLSRDTYLPVDDGRPELLQRVRAVLLGAPAGRGGRATQTAASLFGLRDPARSGGRGAIHLTVPPPTRVAAPGRPEDPRVRRSRRLTIQRRAGVALTSPGRTWLDLAGRTSRPAALLAVTDQMLGRRYPARCLRPHPRVGTAGCGGLGWLALCSPSRIRGRVHRWSRCSAG